MADACATESATSVRIAESPEAASEILEARRAALPALSRLEPLTLLVRPLLWAVDSPRRVVHLAELLTGET